MAVFSTRLTARGMPTLLSFIQRSRVCRSTCGTRLICTHRKLSARQYILPSRGTYNSLLWITVRCFFSTCCNSDAPRGTAAIALLGLSQGLMRGKAQGKRDQGIEVSPLSQIASERGADLYFVH